MGSHENATMQVDHRCLVNALPAMVWTTRGDGRSDFVNRQWCEYTGLGAQAALGYGWQTAVYPEDLKTLLNTWGEIQRGGIQQIDARLRRRDGEYRWFMLQPSSMEDSAGQGFWCWLATFADESVLTDGRLRRLFDIMPWQAGFLNATGVLEFTNQRSLKDFGMSYEELKRWTSAIHEDDHEANKKDVQSLLATGEMMDKQLRMLYPDGTYRWTRARCVPVRDAQGNVVRYLTFQNDVDDLVRAEELMAAEVKLLERVARGEPLSAVLVALARHVEELCNLCSCHIVLVAADRGRFEASVAPSLPDAFHDLHDQRIVRDGIDDPYSAAFIARAPIIAHDMTDDSRWAGSAWAAMMRSHGYASCFLMPILSGSGEVSGIIALYRIRPVAPTARDQDVLDRFAKIASITIDRGRADEALNQARLELTHVARIATLSAMTASITHEVSQPISGILTNSNTCARMLAADPPNVMGAAETIRRTIRDAHRASEVIKRLRAMFAKRAPTIEIFELNDATQEVIAMSSAEMRRNGSVLQTDFADNLPLIRGDRVQLQQVILNLLLNASDAMVGIQNRPRTLHIQTRLHGADSIKLCVRDVGVGLDPQGIEKLFEPFHTTKADGLGIGLAISRSIIESHKGRLWAMANEGPGATFSFCVPAASGDAPDATAVAS